MIDSSVMRPTLHFRELSLAAPLKRPQHGADAPERLPFPRAQPRGPIEAAPDRLAPDRLAPYFRELSLAAPLKHCVPF